MTDVSVITTAISTIGALIGALGGVAFTHGVNVRRDEREARRRRADDQAKALMAAYLDLVGPATQLRVIIELAAQRHWKDMDGRLNAIQEKATIVGLQSARVALLSPGEVAVAAQKLAEAARQLAAEAVRQTKIGYDGDKFLGGQMLAAPDCAPFDDCLKQFYLVGQTSVGQTSGRT